MSLWRSHFGIEIGSGYTCLVFCDLFCWHVLNDTKEARNQLFQGSMKKVSYTDLDGLEVSETFKCKVKIISASLFQYRFLSAKNYMYYNSFLQCSIL